MSGGGKGGKSTTEVKIPEWLQSAARTNMARADEIAKIGYTPYYGPDVAAFSPMQQAAFQNTNDAAAAFGMAAPSNAMAGMPAPQTFAGGVQGYSSAPMYQQSLDALKANAPGQYQAITSMFLDPVTGAQPRSPFGSGGSGGAGGMAGAGGGKPNIFEWAAQTGGSVADYMRQFPFDGFSNGVRWQGYSGEGSNEAARRDAAYAASGRADRDQQGFGQTSGGYTSFADRFDGGGPGGPGNTYQGGGIISRAANSIGSGK